ncbi:MAG: nitroreductase [Planctomycetes bacterium GWF2_42_9]|nr:MAG: nitroreductase [Planctomycetes bacterium GWF2_42_9]
MNEFEKFLAKNETLLSIKNRRSTREFSDQQVSDEDIQTILCAANQAPSAHNQQSWRFVILKGLRKNELAEFVSLKSKDFPRPSSILLRMAARSIASAPIAVAVVNTGELMDRGTELFKVDKNQAHNFFRIMEIQSSAAAVQNLMLAAGSIGLATVWLGILVLVTKEVLQFLDEPEGEFMAIIPVGYALKTGKGPSKKPLAQVVKYL